MRPESGYISQHDYVHPSYGTFGTFGGDNVADNLQSSFLKLKTARQVNLNEDALRLIEEIERKAYEEIERLRKEKLELMQRLNV